MSAADARRNLVRDQGGPGFERYLNGLNDPGRGVLTVTMTPQPPSSDWSGRDILLALGKDVDAQLRRPHSAAVEVRYAAAWVAGERIRELVVVHGEDLPARGWHSLARVADVAGARLWIVFASGQMGRGHRSAAAKLGLAEVPHAALEDALGRAEDRRRVVACPQPQTSTAGVEVHALPEEEFWLWLDACDELVGRAAADVYEREFAAGEDAAAQFLRPGADVREETVLPLLNRLVADCQETWRCTARLRGAQTAFFREWWRLSVNLQKFWAPADDSVASTLTPERSTLLREYIPTRTPAIAVVALASRMPAGDLARIDIHDVAPDGRSFRLAGQAFEVPEHAAGILRAHLARVSLISGVDTLPLFYAGMDHKSERNRHRLATHGITQTLNEVSRSFGMRFVSAFSRPNRTQHWARNSGIKLVDLRPGRP